MLEGPGPEICKAPGAWVGVWVEKEAVGVAAGSLIDIEVLLMTRTGLVEEKKAVDEDLGVVSSLGFQMSHILLCCIKGWFKKFPFSKYGGRFIINKLNYAIK